MSNLKSAYRGGNDDNRAGWRIAFEYDADLIAALKQHIPAELRAWDADRKEWWIGPGSGGRVAGAYSSFRGV